MTQLPSHEFTGATAVGISGKFYTDRGDPRVEASLATAEGWRDKGLPYVAVDGSPEEWHADALRLRGAVVLRSEVNGIATQRQQGARHALAHGAVKLVTQEPEKPDMPTFVDRVAAALEEHDIVVVGRTHNSQESMPPAQRRSERLAGLALEMAFGLPPDALAGPRGYTVAGAQHLLTYPSDQDGMNNWIYMYKNPLDAKAAGQSVGGVEVDLIYPPAMVAQETGNPEFDTKRGKQFELYS